MNILIDQIKKNKNKATIIKKLDSLLINQLPFSIDYHSVLNPCYLNQLSSLQTLAAHFLIRDGIIPIIDYFLKNPSPNPEFPILIIPAIARGFVPKVWHGKILFYENQSLIQKPNLKNLHLYLPTVSDHILHRKEILDRLKEAVKQGPFNSIQLDFIGSSQIIEDEQIENQKFLVYQDLVKIFNDLISVGETYEDYETKANLDHLGIFELAHPLFTYDSYIFHFFSERSAYVFMDNEFEGGEVFELSKYHAQVLYSVESMGAEAGAMYESIKEKCDGNPVTFWSIFQCLRQ